jgi:N-acyl-D-amino-acid deacylase
MMYLFSLIIENGMIVDGTGSLWHKADLGVRDDRIAAIGCLKGAAAQRRIDASGRVVAPGFIDIHTHSDLALLVDGRAESHVRQGVTTSVTGNCGISAAPASEETLALMAGIGIGGAQGLNLYWKTADEYLRAVEEAGVSTNVAALIGHGTVRNYVMGFNARRPTAKEMDAMKAVVEEAMAAGFFGMSTGLVYTPGVYADTDEIVELASAVARHDGLYATHVRGENDTVMTAVQEAIEIGRRTGVRVQISHLKVMGRHMWGTSADLLGAIESARAEGLDVTFDQYPYTASATGLSAVLPPWAQEGGKDEFMKRLRDPDDRDRMRRDILAGTGEWVSMHKGVGWENILVTQCPDSSVEGKSIAEIAEERGKDGFECCFDLLLDFEGQPRMVYFTIGDEDLERIMRHGAGMIGSDSNASHIQGPLAVGKPHPRTFGTFVRVLGHYVREKKIISLEEAVRRMTSFPAQKMRLFDRGLLRPGMKADVVVFDRDSVGDTATYEEPYDYPTGVSTVLVNGQVVVDQGRHTGAPAGRVLRRAEYT